MTTHEQLAKHLHEYEPDAIFDSFDGWAIVRLRCTGKVHEEDCEATWEYTVEEEAVLK